MDRMADRRMFSKSIVLSDEFLDMPTSSRILYFTLGMLADDDGFVNNPRSIMRQIGATNDDLKILLTKKYVILFDSGVIVIRHWRLHNYIQKDRYKQTKCVDEKAQLSIAKDGTYTQDKALVSNLDTECIQSVSNLDTQVRLGKVRLGKDRLDLTGLLTESSSSHSVARSSLDSDGKKKKTVREIVTDAWNSLGVCKITRIVENSQRSTYLKKRVNDYGLDAILKAIENVRTSDFLMGRTKEGFNITFDWFIRPNNFPKVLDGNYNGDKNSHKGAASAPVSEEDLAFMAAMEGKT